MDNKWGTYSLEAQRNISKAWSLFWKRPETKLTKSYRDWYGNVTTEIKYHKIPTIAFVDTMEKVWTVQNPVNDLRLEGVTIDKRSIHTVTTSFGIQGISYQSSGFYERVDFLYVHRKFDKIQRRVFLDHVKKEYEIHRGERRD